MNIKDIGAICNSDLPPKFKRQLIINLIAQDTKAIPDILDLLQAERMSNQEIINDANVNIGRALAVWEQKKGDPLCSKDFLISQARGFYEKHKDHVTCTYNIEGLPKKSKED